MRIALLGEPSTGKSSYLVAVYGALENHRASPLKLVEVLDEVGFLNRGLEALMREERVRRTDVDSQARVALRTRGPNGEVILDVPDRSGELLKAMINGRAWDDELLESVDKLDGALLFLHVLRLDPGRSAQEIDQLLGDDNEAREPAAQDEDPVPWSASLMPDDVRAVDVLQAVMQERARPLPLALILSAWDWVRPEGRQPTAWLAENAPLLAQFLATQPDRLPHAVFGISAQGFDFKHAQDAPAQVRELDPWDRARAVNADGSAANLAQPLLWLATQQQAG